MVKLLFLTQKIVFVKIMVQSMKKIKIYHKAIFSKLKNFYNLHRQRKMKLMTDVSSLLRYCCCNGTSAFPDSFMIFILFFYSCFTLISFSYFNAMTLLSCVYYFPFNTRWRVQTPCLNHPPIFFHLYVIHLIVSRYYPFIVYLPKISAFAYFIPKGTERD